MKKILLLITFLISLIPSFGQSPEKEHIVERGETIATIAKLYNLSPDDLLEANPSAREMVYTGMVLTIPKSNATSSSYTQLKEDNKSGGSDKTQYDPGNGSNGIIVHEASQTSDSNLSNAEYSDPGITRFSCIALTYLAQFKYFEHGFYGIYWQTFSESGWGGTFSINGNWGTGSGDIMFKLGPMYGHMVTDWCALNASLRGTIATCDKYDKKTGKTKTGVTGGITVTPALNFKVGRLILGLGYEMGWWHNMKGLYHEAQFIIGMDL